MPRSAHFRSGIAVVAALCGSPSYGEQTEAALAEASLADLSLEQLSDIEVLSVSRAPEPLAEAPASIYVITNEEIRRSGATSLGEALRLAPNLQVARINSVQYAITARGFNNSLANKLLVLIDGRTVYTPLFSGVFWDEQDVVLEDIERIEVISGPGATLWGANAVNGVINVITRSAADTQGGLVSVGGGNFERPGRCALRRTARRLRALSRVREGRQASTLRRARTASPLWTPGRGNRWGFAPTGTGTRRRDAASRRL